LKTLTIKELTKEVKFSLQNLIKENKVTVEGINIVKKAMKPTQAKPQGGIVEITKPIWVSKVALIDPADKKPTRIGYKFDKNGDKVRVYKRSGKEVK
jgi:large subunit ribosomal protein L24